MAQGQIKEGLLQYDRAIFVQRVNFGLFDSNQLNIIYKEADGLKTSRRFRRSSKKRRIRMRNTPARVHSGRPAPYSRSRQAGEFYDSIYAYLASRVFYRKSLQILIANGREWELEAIPLHNGIAHSYLMEPLSALLRLRRL